MGTNQTLLRACLLITTYLIGIYISDKVIPPNVLQAYDNDATSTVNTKLDEIAGINNAPISAIFQNIRFAMHRNGELEACGHSIKKLSEVMPTSKDSMVDKYEFDQFLTASLGKSALDSSTCGPEQPPPEIKGKRRKTWGRGEDYSIDGIDSSFLTFCDMGEDRTPILPDHKVLIPVETDGVSTLPCHFHTREGLRFTSYKMLLEYVHEVKNTRRDENAMDVETKCSVMEDGSTVCAPNQSPSMDIDVHIYAVPAGRSFVFAPSYIGEIFEINHVESGRPFPIYLKVMSLSPRVFDIINFFDKEESKSIVDKALRETSESHKIKRSSTGSSGYNVNSQRTSENGFDTHGKTAISVKKRCMKVLGFDTYIESFTDGLQVLRYNKTTAYIPHMDWIDDPQKREVHNFESSRLGTNRFATILLYMSDLGEGDGGETVFKNGWPIDVPVEERKAKSQALEELRASGAASFLKTGSWEELMVADCRSRLAVRPHSARAVLFYSQHPNGEEDTSSLHGGCPVLHGEKWAANLWVWNGPRGGFIGSPKNKGREEKPDATQGYAQIKAVFRNTGKDPKFAQAKLYFQETYWGEFSHEDPPLNVNTFEGHEWNIKRISDGKLLKQIIIPGDRKKLHYEV